MVPRCLSLSTRYKRPLILIVPPIVLILLPAIVQTKEALAGYILGLMAVYWVTEVIPLGVTALIPVVLTPLFGILGSKKLCPTYMKDTNVLFMGGLMVATAVEHHNLHKRIALASMMITGTSPGRLMLGFMLPSWFLSMWISNTATTAMLVPIVEAVLNEMKEHSSKPLPTQLEMENDIGRDPLPIGNNDEEENNEESESESLNNPEHTNLGKAMLISIAYAASCGGIATLTGTGPNLVLNNLITSTYDSRAKFGFGIWMIYAFPISLVSLAVVWIWLQVYFLGFRQFFRCSKNQEAENSIKEMIRRKYRALGPISFAEGSCLFFFTLLVFLWISKSPGVDGWVRWFVDDEGKHTTTDAQPAILISIIIFMWPAKNPFRKTHGELAIEEGGKKKKAETLLTWTTVQNNFPWNIVFLLGGGFALAATCEASGLSRWIGASLVGLRSLPVGVLILIIAVCSAFFTEFTSNTATASILMPILNELARCINVHPFALILPATAATSLAFCLPVATPPNAIVFSKGYLTVWDMMKVGFVLNLLCILIVTAATLTYATPFFQLNTYPEWAGMCTMNATMNISE